MARKKRKKATPDPDLTDAELEEMERRATELANQVPQRRFDLIYAFKIPLPQIDEDELVGHLLWVIHHAKPFPS